MNPLSCEWFHSFSVSPLFRQWPWLWLCPIASIYWILYPLRLAALCLYSVGQFDRVQQITNAKCVMNFSVYFSLASGQVNWRIWKLGIRYRRKPKFLIEMAFHPIRENEYDNDCTSVLFHNYFFRLFFLHVFFLVLLFVYVVRSSFFLLSSSMSHNVCIWYIFMNFSPFSRIFLIYFRVRFLFFFSSG